MNKPGEIYGKMIEIINGILFIVNFVLVCTVVSIILNQNKKQEIKKARKKLDVVSLFHHIHHKGEKVEHKVHHCGGEHVKINPKLNYTITHCKCGKHKIDVKEATGHDNMSKEVVIVFKENCPEGGWHIESGRIKNDN